MGAIAATLAVRTDRSRGPDNAPGQHEMRRIGESLGADEFGIFSVLSAAGTTRLVSLLDASHPQTSLLCRSLGRQSAEPFAHAALAGLAPAVWFDGNEGTRDRARWVRRIAPPIPGTSGVAMPLPVERGSGGLAVFAGDDIRTSQEEICDAHLACLALFREIGRPRAVAASPALTPREQECLRMTADGMTSDDIASSLGLSVHTTNQYIASTIHKLNAVNRMHAVAKALRMGLFD